MLPTQNSEEANIGSGAKEENRLFEFPLTGHYRITTDGSTNRIEHDQ